MAELKSMFLNENIGDVLDKVSVFCVKIRSEVDLRDLARRDLTDFGEFWAATEEFWSDPMDPSDNFLEGLALVFSYVKEHFGPADADYDDLVVAAFWFMHSCMSFQSAVYCDVVAFRRELASAVYDRLFMTNFVGNPSKQQLDGIRVYLNCTYAEANANRLDITYPPEDKPEDKPLTRGDTAYTHDGTPYAYDPAAYPYRGDEDD